jgi:hypothetical protein
MRVLVHSLKTSYSNTSPAKNRGVFVYREEQTMGDTPNNFQSGQMVITPDGRVMWAAQPQPDEVQPQVTVEQSAQSEEQGTVTKNDK